MSSRARHEKEQDLDGPTHWILTRRNVRSPREVHRVAADFMCESWQIGTIDEFALYSHDDVYTAGFAPQHGSFVETMHIACFAGKPVRGGISRRESIQLATQRKAFSRCSKERCHRQREHLFRSMITGDRQDAEKCV